VVSVTPCEGGPGYALGDVVSIPTSATQYSGGSGFSGTIAKLTGVYDMHGSPFLNEAGTDRFNSVVSDNNLFIGQNYNGAVFDAMSNIVANNNVMLEDVEANIGDLQPKLPSLMVSKNAHQSAGANFDYNAVNNWSITTQGDPVTCRPASDRTSCKTIAATLDAVRRIAPNWSFSEELQRCEAVETCRAQIIAKLVPTPSVGGSVNPADDGAGHWSWIVWPPDSRGQVCFAVGSKAFDPAVDCTTVSVIAQ
jgi:hypothetical protein